MKILLVTATNSHKAGGLFYSVKNLTKGLLRHKINIKLLSYSDECSEKDLPTYKGIPMLFYNVSKLPLLNRLGFSCDIDRIIDRFAPDIIHQQGIWMWHSHATCSYKRKHKNTKTIITPRGMLDPWLKRNSPVVKKIVGLWYENSNLRNADCLHALCLSELESIRQCGLKNPVAVIPNGTTIPNWERPTLTKTKKTILYLSRLDPKKGVDIMISSLGIINKNNPSLLQNWRFLIGGWGEESYISQLKGLSTRNGLDCIIEFIGSKYGDEKEELLKSVDAFILPSHSEGLPMAVLEAWAYQLPVIMTEYCNIPEGFSSNSAVRIDVDAEKMAGQLSYFLSLSNDDMNLLGRNGFELVKTNFDWDVIAQKVICLYEWLLDKGPKPDFVYE